MYIFVLVKMFKTKEHADAFRNGKLYANTLEYFQRREENRNQFDPDEGVIHLPVNNTVFTIGDQIITPDSGLLGMSMAPNHLKRINIVCLYAMHSGELPDPNSLPADINPYRHEFEIPQISQTDFGPHAVAITNVKKFRDRIDKALTQMREKKLIRRFDRRMVTYTDFGTMFDSAGNFLVYTLAPAFVKRSKFSHENEFRIAVDFNDLRKQPRTIDIGDISDISFCIQTSEIKARATVPIQH